MSGQLLAVVQFESERKMGIRASLLSDAVGRGNFNSPLGSAAEAKAFVAPAVAVWLTRLRKDSNSGAQRLKARLIIQNSRYA
jgi:hypothetical protein